MSAQSEARQVDTALQVPLSLPQTTRFSSVNTPQTLNYSRQIGPFKDHLTGPPAALTKRGRSLISRANCAR